MHVCDSEHGILPCSCFNAFCRRLPVFTRAICLCFTPLSDLSFCEPKGCVEVEKSRTQGMLPLQTARYQVQHVLVNAPCRIPRANMHTQECFVGLQNSHRYSRLAPHKQIVEEIVRYAPDVVCLQVFFVVNTAHAHTFEGGYLCTKQSKRDRERDTHTDALTRVNTHRRWMPSTIF